MLVERKVDFILEAGNRGRRQTHAQRPTPHCQGVGKSFYRGVAGVYRQKKGDTFRAARSALAVILKLVMRWSDLWHLDCFKESSSLVSRSVSSHFFEARSQNCGSFCHSVTAAV